MALCHTCCTRYSSSHTSPPPLFCLRTHTLLVPLFALLIKQLQASAFIWQSFDVSPHRLHWHPFHGKLLHRLPLPTLPLFLSPLQAPAVRTCLALPLSHSTAEAQPTGQLPLSNFHMQSQLTFCGCHSKWHNLTPPPPSSLPSSHYPTLYGQTVPPPAPSCSSPMFVCTCLATLLSL